MAIGKGRRLIIVDDNVNINTILSVMQKAWQIHQKNLIDINWLLGYESGRQNRDSVQATDSFYGENLKNQTTINYASSTTRTIVGYTFSQGFQITQKNGAHLKDIEKLINIMNYENSETADHEAGTLASITGIAYEGTFPTRELYSDYMPDYPIVHMSLDPRNTFIVYSPEPGNPSILSCTYYYTKDKNKTVFYCYTDDETYMIECSGNGYNTSAKIIDFDINPIGLNPITLIKNNQFMRGDWETATKVSDALNLLASDSLTDVENVIKSLLIIINAELTGEEAQKARKNRIIQLMSQPGVQADAKFIYQQLDSEGMQDLREYLEEAYKTIVGIPDRKTRGGGGGDTGDAVKLRDGWADIEIVARIKENYFKPAKKKQLGVAIRILQLLNLVSKEFKLEDISVQLPRNKNDNIQTKAQSYSTLISTNTIAPEDALAMSDMTTDITGVVKRGKQYKEKMLENQAKTQNTQKAQGSQDTQQSNKEINNNSGINLQSETKDSKNITDNTNSQKISE